MGFTIGQAFRGVLIGKQSAFGTVATEWKFGEVDDESFRTTYDILQRQDVSRMGVSKTATGKRYGEGSINMAMDTSPFMAYLVLGAYGKSSVSGSGNPYTHTFEEITHAQAVAGSNTDFASWDFKVLRDEKMHRYTSMLLNRLSVRANVGEYVQVSADFMGKAEGSDSQTSPAALPVSLDDDPHAIDALHFSQCDVVFDDGSGNTTKTSSIASIEFDINLNRDLDASYSLGTDTCVRAPPPQRREITGTVEFFAPIHTDTYDEPTYAELIADGGAVYDPSGATPALKLTFTSGTEVVTFEFLRVRWEAPESNVSGRDTQTMRVPFTALANTGGSMMSKVTIVSSNLGSSAL